MKDTEFISVKKLSYKKIFDNVNLNIEQGTFVSISGSNNCGKTTLIKLLSGLISTENMVFYKGVSLENINKTKLFYDEGIVLLNEKVNFLFDNVKDEILFVLDNIRIDEEIKNDRYKEVVKLLDLQDYEKVNPNSLNKNQKVLLLLALAIIHKPKVLYLDNIDSMMSKQDRKHIMDILHHLNKKEKMTIIMATTNLENVLDTDYIYILSNGGIALEGVPYMVLQDDNIINKLGLDIPFMMDLSVKLKDYNLLKDICLDMEGMVELLWK